MVSFSLAAFRPPSSAASCSSSDTRPRSRSWRRRCSRRCSGSASNSTKSSNTTSNKKCRLLTTVPTNVSRFYISSSASGAEEDVSGASGCHQGSEQGRTERTCRLCCHRFEKLSSAKKRSREISNLCSFTDAGGDEREAKKLRKEFNSDVQRAKDELGIDARKSGV